MGSSPRLVLAVAVLLAPSAAVRAADVPALLAAVEANARFARPALATGTLVWRHAGGEERMAVRLAGRRSTLRIDAGDDRALVRRGKALVRRGDAAPRLGVDATIGGSNVRFGDLAVLGPRLFRNPQIVDEGLAGTVVAAAPAGASSWVLLVVTIDPKRALATQVKYYEHAINNLVKRDRRSDFVEVDGTPRPARLATWDVQGDGTSEMELAWRPAPELGWTPFTRAGLATPLGP